ncbi:204aa long hypothetical protein [Pyrococcus horikoshii OT3]|uniref:Uncharacterized protein n=2 Tax=Pyrococcus horikoshii TaxID=53953 RepID=O58911_PYRHO|nr:204aa long hypothetical protein [Pyrococcus horikoshii OT3]
MEDRAPSEENVSYIELIRESVYELVYRDVMPRDIAVRFLAIPPEILDKIFLSIVTGVAGAALYDGIKAVVKNVLFKRKIGTEDPLRYFKKIAISAVNRKDGSLAIYLISKSIILHPYQNVALFGIDGTPVLDFRKMDPEGACFKLGKNSMLFLKNFRIRKYTTQKLFEGDGRVIYSDDVIIEEYDPPGEKEEREIERYIEIEFL